MYMYCDVLPIDDSDMAFYERHIKPEDDEQAAEIAAAEELQLAIRREARRAMQTIERALKRSHKAKTHPYRMKLVEKLKTLRSL